MFRMFSTITLLGSAIMSAAYAQSAQPIQAAVPFAFTVQATTLAAGNYQLTYSNTAHVLSIRGLDQNSVGAFVTAVPVDASESSSQSSKLAFQCYGKACFLAQVWRGGPDGNRGLKLRQTEPQRALAFTTRAVSVTIPAK